MEINRWNDRCAQLEQNGMEGISANIRSLISYNEIMALSESQFDSLVKQYQDREAGALADEQKRVEARRLFDNKQSRFQQSARLLTGKYSVRVDVINSPMMPPACYNLKSHVLTLNQNFPATEDDAERLIYDRGLIYHECAHVKWTRDHSGIREKLSKASPNPDLFMDISNILEDGRIEWLMSKIWHGSKAYLDSLIKACFEQNKNRKSPLSGLVFYVRYGRFLTDEQTTYWKPVIALIDKGIRSLTTKAAMEIADQIVRIMHKAGMNPPPIPQIPNPKGQDEPDDEEQDSKDRGQSESEDEQDGAESEQNATQNAPEGQSSDNAGDGELSEADKALLDENPDSGESTSEAGGKGAGGKGEMKPNTLEDYVNEVAKNALESLRAEAEREVAELKEPAPIEEKPSKPQQFDTSDEESEAGQVALILRSIKVERARRQWTPANRSGKIDTRRIVGIRTGDSFLARRDSAKGEISVALLIDCSGSMGGQSSRIAAECGRILNGALQSVGMASVVVLFSDSIRVVSRMPSGRGLAGGGTDTAGAMEAASAWLEKQKKSNGKGLLLIVTDGCPNSPQLCVEHYNRLKDAGNCHVIAFIIGGYGYSSHWQVSEWCDKSIQIANVSNLSGQLESVLIESAGML